jgi:hypothetical protein
MHTAIVQHVPAPALALAALLALVGCGKPPANGPAAADPGAAAPAAASTGPKADDVKIAKENWPNGKLKFQYEMRRNPDGKWARNGIARAYYDHGVLQREGLYRNNVRVGEWKYYKADGTLDYTEDRGEGKAE